MERRTEARAAWRLILGVWLVGVLAGCRAQLVVPRWDPAAFRALSTLQFLTIGPEEGPHWSTVWLVIVDDHVYIRLGSRAAGRMRANTTAPYVEVRIGGRGYQHVRATDAPAMAGQVAAAMAEKYTSDLLIRHLAHPLTIRLEPEAASSA